MFVFPSKFVFIDSLTFKICCLCPFQKFYQNITKKSSKQLKSLQGKPLNAPATNYCQMLQEIAEAQRFEVVYTDIPELSAYGKCKLYFIFYDL